MNVVAMLRVVAIKYYDQTMYDFHTNIIKDTGSKHKKEKENTLKIELIKGKTLTERQQEETPMCNCKYKFMQVKITP